MTASRRRLRTPGRQARLLRWLPRQARLSNAGAFFLEARGYQRLQGDRAAVRATVFNLLLVAIFLRSHLAGEPFARVDTESRTPQDLTVFLVARRVLPIALHPVIAGIVGDQQNVVDKTVRLGHARVVVLIAKILVLSGR
jgi:hypothetical protein